jgi:hypothetical protein
MKESSGASFSFIASISCSSRSTWRSLIRSGGYFGFSSSGAEVEEVVLDSAEHRVGVARRVQPRDADRRVRLVHGAEGRYAGRGLGHARAVAERGLPCVAAAGVDARQSYHQPSLGSRK